MDHKDELIQMQNDLIRTMTENNLKRMTDDFWGSTASNLDDLQKELEARTAEIGKDLAADSGKAVNTENKTEETNKEEEKTEEEKPKNHDKRKQNVFSEKTENTFGDLNIDEDKALLLALIMLLSEEKGDELLIMALIYMLT